MKPLIPYLFFNGNCREAMEFYKDCFGGELASMPYSEAPPGNQCGDGDKDKIMHAMLTSGELTLMASDNPMAAPILGDNVHININCDTLDEIETVFKRLSAGGNVVQALHDAFWGSRFGMLTDKYGFRWMLNCQLKK